MVGLMNRSSAKGAFTEHLRRRARHYFFFLFSVNLRPAFKRLCAWVEMVKVIRWFSFKGLKFQCFCYKGLA